MVMHLLQLEHAPRPMTPPTAWRLPWCHLGADCLPRLFCLDISPKGGFIAFFLMLRGDSAAYNDTPETNRNPAVQTALNIQECSPAVTQNQAATAIREQLSSTSGAKSARQSAMYRRSRITEPIRLRSQI